MRSRVPFTMVCSGCFLLLAAQLACGIAKSPVAGPSSTAVSKESSWVLSWSDEFTGANGSLPDPSKWTLETGGDGWGNQELEYYTDRPRNVHIQDGHLVIVAMQEAYTGPDHVTRSYTSARLKTAGKFEQTYGRMEARIQIPFGQGLWPAFWMLGNDIQTAGWPTCGEIDIMENIGRESGTVYATLHGPGYSAAHGIGSPYSISSGRFADDFHVYGVEWEPDQIRFYVDDQFCGTHRSSEVPPGSRWVFDHPFYLILNVAVGGGWPGNPDASTVFPQMMKVDYVRVYTKAAK